MTDLVRAGQRRLNLLRSLPVGPVAAAEHEPVALLYAVRLGIPTAGLGVVAIAAPSRADQGSIGQSADADSAAGGRGNGIREKCHRLAPRTAAIGRARKIGTVIKSTDSFSQVVGR